MVIGQGTTVLTFNGQKGEGLAFGLGRLPGSIMTNFGAGAGSTIQIVGVGTIHNG